MSTVAVIATIGLGTYALRASMFVVLGRRTPPEWMRTPLAFVGPAAIAALVGTGLLTSSGRVSIGSIGAVVAAAVAFAVVRRTDNVMHAFTVGLPVYWLLALFGV